MTASTRLGPDDGPQLKKGELKALAAKGIARVVPNKGNMVKAIRAKLKMSQSQFASAFRLSLRTVQQWEQGRYAPDQIARNYLSVIKTKPDLVRNALKRA